MQSTTAQALQALFLEALSRGEHPAGSDGLAAEFAQRAMAAVGAPGPDLGLNIRPDVNRFFSYNPDSGSLIHPTAQDACEAARLDIAYFREAARTDGEWPAEVEDVCWGQIHGRAVGKDDDRGTDFELVSKDTPAALEELSVASLVMTGQLKARRLFAVMAACGLGAITLNQRIDVDAVATLLDHLLGSEESEGEQAALAWIAAFFKEKGVYPSLVQCYAAGQAARPEDNMGVEVAARRGLAHELAGVVADIKMGQPFDAVCLQTIERVRDSLYVDPADAPKGMAASGWPSDVALWVEEQRYRREGPLTSDELSQLLLRKFGSSSATACTLADLVFAFNAALLARLRPRKNNGQASDFLSAELLRHVERSMVKLGIATGEGGQERFAAQLESNLRALCAGIDRAFNADPAAAALPEGGGTALIPHRQGVRRHHGGMCAAGKRP